MHGPITQGELSFAPARDPLTVASLVFAGVAWLAVGVGIWFMPVFHSARETGVASALLFALGVGTLSVLRTRYVVGRHFVRVVRGFRTRSIAGSRIGTVSPTGVLPPSLRLSRRNLLAIRDREGRRIVTVAPAEPDEFIRAVTSLAMSPKP